jgi:exopolysaccharide biosynthesis polyprenyl glycosylphosphotransferase
MGKSNKLILLIVALSDALLINLGFILAFGLRLGFPIPEFNFSPYLSLIPWISLATFVIFYMFDLYANWRCKSIYNLFYSIILAVLMLTVLTMALTFWYRGFAFPRSVLSVSVFVQVFLLAASRYLFWLIGKSLYGSKKVLIIGNNPEDGLSIAEKFVEHAKGWFVIQDFLLASELKKLDSKIINTDVVILSPNLQEKMEIINRCAQYGKEVLLVPELFELFIFGSETQQIDDLLVFSIQAPKLSSSQLLIKRAFDIVGSTFLFILLSPLLVLLYILIPLTSRGPALFKQERLGKDGKPYQILKFRSMIKDAEVKTGPVLAADKDPRITPIGRIIRATRMDELPQLVNVIKGEMSFVGPRPERSFFIQQFKEAIPHYAYRMNVKPGITGLAQVMAKYSTTVEDKLRFDLMYVRGYSLALDIKIILQTIRVVLQREQAGGVKDVNQGVRENLIDLFGDSRAVSNTESIRRPQII